MNKLDQIVVLDIESTCWVRDQQPPDQVSEIIEIGFCCLNMVTLEIAPSQSWFVRPVESRVSEFCTALTTITQAHVDQGILFSEACVRVRELMRKGQRMWASYGDYDREQFKRQCERTNIQYPFGRTHLNVKNLAALCCGWHKEIGLERAMERLGLSFVGTPHRGPDDAANIARILKHLLQSSRLREGA